MFNNEIAERISKSISRMDPDEAEMFARFFVYEVHKTDIENNRRTIDRHIVDVSKRLVSALETISKKTPYELEYGKPQPRNKRGRWAKSGSTDFKISIERKKESGPPAGGNLSVGDFDVTSALARSDTSGKAFANEWARSDARDPGTNDRLYRRVQAGSQLLQQMPSNKAKLAGIVGEFAGEMGPEAEKVIGPAARRTAYRYRGTERMPDETMYKLHDRMLDNESRRLGIGSQSITPEIRMATAEDAAKMYLVKRLPSKQLSKLQLESGKLPPSEGVIINADGDIVTQAVGYNEDHYLPFNLKNLKGLQGGSYVRTRSTGGLTSEDIYTGLIAGARSVTVVSRTGVFTLDFNDDLRGGRRYSDKARQMVGQYARILDSVGSGKVARRGLEPAERAQIREEVEDEYKTLGYTAEEIETEIRQREKAYQSGIRFTKDEIDEVDARAKQLADEWTPLGSRSSMGGERTDAINAKPDKVPVNDAARFRYFRSELMDGLMDEKESRMYQLDADGYADAMKALQEQFPYFIANVDTKKLTDRSGQPAKRTERDTGYVRPNYNRPKAVRAGYFDEEIEGKGKYSAADTNYQNWGVRNRGKQNDTEKEVSSEETPMQQKRKEQAAAAARQIQLTAKTEMTAALKAPVKEYGSLIAGTDNFPNKGQYKNLIEAAKYDDVKWSSLSADQVMKIANEFQMAAEQVVNFQNDGLTKRVQTVAEKIPALEGMMSDEVDFDSAGFSFTAPVPAKPYVFKKGAPEHSYNQSPETYSGAWKQVANRSHVGAWISSLGVDSPSASDEQLRVAQTKVQTIGAAAEQIKAARSSGDQMLLAEAVNNAGDALYEAGIDASVEAGQNRARKMAKSDEDRPIDSMIKSARDVALALIEMRSIKMHSQGAMERQNTARGEVINENASASQQTISSTASSTPQKISPKSVADDLQRMANGASGAPDQRIFLALRKLVNDGDIEAASTMVPQLKDPQSRQFVKDLIDSIER